MLKNYVIIFGYFFIISNAVAQLPNDLARFTQTLQNVTAKLSFVRKPEVAAKPTGKIIKTITLPPLTFDVTLPDGKKVEAPSGSVIEIRDTGLLVKIKIEESDIVETSVKLPYAGLVEISDAASVKFPDGSVAHIPFGGATINVPGDNTIKIQPKNPAPPVPADAFKHVNDVIRLAVPADGVVILPNGENIKVPVGSRVLIYSSGLEIQVPPTGGDVQLPSTGGRIGIANMFNATLQLPDGSFKRISSDDYAKIFTKGTVKVIPEDTLPPIRRDLILGKKVIKIPARVRTELKDGLTIYAPEETLVRKLYDGLVITLTASGGDVTLSGWGTYIGLPEGSPAVTVELPDGRKGEIVGGGYIIVPPGTTKIRPILRESKTIKPQVAEE